MVERCGRRFDSLVTGTKLYIALLGKMLKMVLQVVTILSIRSFMLGSLSSPCGQQMKSIRYIMVMAFLFLKRDEFSSCNSDGQKYFFYVALRCGFTGFFAKGVQGQNSKPNIFDVYDISFPPAVQHHLPFVNILNYTVLRLRPMFSTPTAS